jgi:hypothetical protein
MFTRHAYHPVVNLFVNTGMVSGLAAVATSAMTSSMMFSMGHRVVKFKRGRDRIEFVTYDKAMYSDILTVRQL